MGVIFNIQRYCLHDGDGIRTTVFFKGCPLRCIWCHNPEGLSSELSVSYNREKCTLCGRCIPTCSAREIVDGAVIFDRSRCTFCNKCTQLCLNSANELIGKEVSADEVLAEALKDKIYYKTSGGGITLSGGEPSMQADFALEIIEKARCEGVGVAIETCGMGKREFYEKARELGATFLYDIKCMDPERHRELTGASNERILSNLRYLLSEGADVIIRLPMIPGINDRDEDIDALCRFLSENEERIRYAELMPYHSFGVSKAERLGKENVFCEKDATSGDKERWVSAFLERGVNVKLSQ
ncbi:MAG: glycyl-radical enzyme activating protein [Ruminococcaceae bacterium]|nr:glycyl-radical enzyme activating protein [Oscillospiraceae bacterium]